MMERNDQNKSDEALNEEGSEVEVYRGADVWELVKQLQAEKRRDPQAVIRLVMVYEQILDQFIPNSNLNLYASIQTSTLSKQD